MGVIVGLILLHWRSTSLTTFTRSFLFCFEMKRKMAEVLPAAQAETFGTRPDLEVTCADGVKFLVNKAVLIEASPVLAAMLGGSFEEASASTIHLADDDSHLMRMVFKMLYSVFKEDLSIDDLYALDCAEMAALADKYNLAGIKGAISAARDIRERVAKESRKPGNVVRDEHRPPPGMRVEAANDDDGIHAGSKGKIVYVDLDGGDPVIGVLWNKIMSSTHSVFYSRGRLEVEGRHKHVENRVSLRDQNGKLKYC
jgi:hypothetical protein